MEKEFRKKGSKEESHELFKEEFTSKLYCKYYSKKSETRNNFKGLHLDIPTEESRITLQKYLEGYKEEEEVTVHVQMKTAKLTKHTQSRKDLRY